MLASSAAKPPPTLQPTTKAHLPYLPGATAKSGAKTSGVAVPARRPESLLVNKATGTIAERSGAAASARRFADAKAKESIAKSLGVDAPAPDLV